MSEFPRLGAEEPQLSRGRIVRRLIFYGAGSALCIAVVLLALTYILFLGEGGFVIMLGFFLFMGLPFTFFAMQYLRDLSARPVSVEGEVIKKWHKGNMLFFFMPSFYIVVQGTIYTITRVDYVRLLENDLVRITHYPHSLTVELVERYDEYDKRFVPAASA
jgi:hypothetical protein